MPIILAVLAALAAVWFFVIRARNAADMAHEVLDAANDVRLAARRFGFRRRANKHPVDAIEERAIAIAALGAAFLELDGLPTAEQRAALVAGLSQLPGVSQEDAGEMAVLGRWIVTQCTTPSQAVDRLARRLYSLAGDEGFQPLMEVIHPIAGAGSGGLNDNQREALEHIRRAFRLT